MLTRLGAMVIRRRRIVLVGAAVIFVASGAYGGPVAEHLSAGGFDDPGSESFRADEALLDTFGSSTPNLILLVTAPGGNVDDPAAVAAGTALTDELAAEPDVVNVGSYWTLGNAPPLRSDGSDRALVLARIEGTQDEVNDRVEELTPKYTRDGELVVGVGGFGEVFREVGTTIEEDLVRAETIALPITLILLLLVFGTVVSASLPLAIGALSVVGTFVVLRLLSTVTEVSIFSLNLTTAMGLGLAIDYSLFMVSRFREELRVLVPQPRVRRALHVPERRDRRREADRDDQADAGDRLPRLPLPRHGVHEVRPGAPHRPLRVLRAAAGPRRGAAGAVRRVQLLAPAAGRRGR